MLTGVACRAQETVRGRVRSGGEAVRYAKVVLLPAERTVHTDAEGGFVFEGVAAGRCTLRVTAVGYKAYRREIAAGGEGVSVELEADGVLEEVVVTGTLRETAVKESVVKVAVLSPALFRSSPVSSVVGALETVNGVQEQVNCGVCGTSAIRINGMEGPYTLVLIDGMPIVSGLSSVYGFNGIPTSLIERVEIVKGPCSTLYGTEAVGGVVNIITRRPDRSPSVEADVRYTTHREAQASLGWTARLGERLYTVLSGDYSSNDRRLDENGDGFTDIPLGRRLSVFNKWQLRDGRKREVLTVAARYYSEDRWGGELAWTKADRGSGTVYGESIRTERWEVLGSYRFPFADDKVRLDVSANAHKQAAWYGDVSYSARQQVGFANLVWTPSLNARHAVTGGWTNRYNRYEDNTPSLTDENSYVPGLFVQDEYRVSEGLRLLGGLRLDYHRRHGVIFSPRLNAKQQLGPFSALRLNYGTGFRQVHLFTEDHAFVSGAREVLIADALQPERSHNLSLNVNHTYLLWGYGQLDVDVFYTYFQNKIVPDYAVDPDWIVYDNLSGYGVSRGMAVAVDHSFAFPLHLRAGATWMAVFERVKDEEGQQQRVEQLFTPRFSAVFGATYRWKRVDATLNWTGRVVGPQQLPTFAEGFERPTVSDWFTVQHLQLTKCFDKLGLEVYTGVKNLWNYTQDSPLIHPQAPFSAEFDTSYAYGPLQVRRYFLGIRWSLQPKRHAL